MLVLDPREEGFNGLNEKWKWDVIFWRKYDRIFLLVLNGSVDKTASYPEEAVRTDEGILVAERFGFWSHVTS